MRPKKNSKVVWIVTILALICSISAIVYFISTGYDSYRNSAIAMVLVILILFHVNKKINFGGFVIFGLCALGIFNLCGGIFQIDGLGLYNVKIIEIVDYGADFYILKMDQVVHFFAYLIICLFLYKITKYKVPEIENQKHFLFLIFLASVGIGALYEIVEFVSFISWGQIGVGDVYNVCLDLIFDSFGALLGLLIRKLV